MEILTNVSTQFRNLTLWMPETFQHFVNAVFLFFCASALINITTKFVKFVRG